MSRGATPGKPQVASVSLLHTPSLSSSLPSSLGATRAQSGPAPSTGTSTASTGANPQKSARQGAWSLITTSPGSSAAKRIRPTTPTLRPVPYAAGAPRSAPENQAKRTRAQPLSTDMHPVVQPGTAAGSSVAAAEAPVSVVCHIRPLSVREAADAAPDVLAVLLKPSNRPGKPADALVESGGASYAFDHGAVTFLSHVVKQHCKVHFLCSVNREGGRAMTGCVPLHAQFSAELVANSRPACTSWWLHHSWPDYSRALAGQSLRTARQVNCFATAAVLCTCPDCSSCCFFLTRHLSSQITTIYAYQLLEFSCNLRGLVDETSAQERKFTLAS